jgi:hypothetical protein
MSRQSEQARRRLEHDIPDLADDQLQKVVRRIKNETLDKAEIWQELFQSILPYLIEGETPSVMKSRVKLAAEICDLAIEESESRWG